MNKKRIYFYLKLFCIIVSITNFAQWIQASEGVLNIAVQGEILNLDPTLISSGADRTLCENWGEFLLSRATSGAVIPGLVTSWKVSPDGKKIELTLREGVKFHSGDLFTTKDVEFSFKRSKAMNTSGKRNLALIERLEIVDDYHINFYFKAPDVVFIPRRCAFVIASKSYHERVGEKTFTKQPSGTGPYKVTSYKPGEYVEIERFEEYWGEKPPIKRARFYFVAEDTTRVAKLKAGEADLISAVPYTEVKELEKLPNIKVVKNETNHPTAGVMFGAKNPKMPWYDKRVRLAIAHAIDWKSIIHNLLHDVPIHLAALAPGELGYDPELKPYDYDPEKSKALLNEAGYPNGFDIKLLFPIGGRVTMAKQTAEMVANYLRTVGIRAELIGKEHRAMVAARSKALDPNAEFIAYFTYSFPGSVDPIHFMSGSFKRPSIRAIFEHPEVSKLLDEGRKTMDNQKRGELIKKAVKILYDEVAVVPVFTSVTVFAMKNNIDFIPTKGESFSFVLVKDMAYK